MPEMTIIPLAEELLTINAAVARSGISRYRLERAILLARLHAVRSGERIMIPVDALDRYVAERGDTPQRSA